MGESTVKAEIIGIGAKTARLSSSRLGEKTQPEDSLPALTKEGKPNVLARFSFYGIGGVGLLPGWLL